eukprot:TRINITY_DN28143_c0_g1_i1.p1 TRINITY_DN28143_c0_g1~~TRINITY_DN28143_c0_g1_i1.p1  ORF type:complete len:605 (+),score=41.65 TRINITY_DN28143_c0_g1_i1:160-1974(+)
MTYKTSSIFPPEELPAKPQRKSVGGYPASGVLPGQPTDSLWASSTFERSKGHSRFWGKGSACEENGSKPTTPRPRVPSCNPQDGGACLRRGDMEVPARWEVVLASDDQRQRASSIDGVLPGNWSDCLWASSTSERSSFWGKLGSPRGEKGSKPTTPRQRIPSCNSTPEGGFRSLRRGDMEVPSRWDVALSSDELRQRASSMDDFRARERSDSVTSQTRRRASFPGTGKPARSTSQCCDTRARSRSLCSAGSYARERSNSVLSTGSASGDQAGSETPVGRPVVALSHFCSDPWAGRFEPIEGGISDRRRRAPSITTQSTALYNSPRPRSRSTASAAQPVEDSAKLGEQNDGLAAGVQHLLWGSSAFEVPELFCETRTPRGSPMSSSARARANLRTQRDKAAPCQPEQVADNVCAAPASSQRGRANTCDAMTVQAAMTAVEPAVARHPRHDRFSLVPPFGSDTQASSGVAAVPGLFRRSRSNGQDTAETASAEQSRPARGSGTAAGASGCAQVYHPSRAPAFTRRDPPGTRPRQPFTSLASCLDTSSRRQAKTSAEAKSSPGQLVFATRSEARGLTSPRTNAMASPRTTSPRLTARDIKSAVQSLK